MARRPDYLGTWMSDEHDEWLVRVEPRSRRASAPKVGLMLSLRVRRKDGVSQQMRVRIVEQRKRYSLAEPLEEPAAGGTQQQPTPDAAARAERLEGVDLADTHNSPVIAQAWGLP